MAAPDPSVLLDLAVRAARAAGAELLARYGNVEGLDTKSSATDPVSDADRASEALIVSMLTEERPDDGLIGEEGASRPSASGITWVIDPLDGTVNYLYQLDNFSVSIAAQDSAGGLVGAVYDPVLDRMYTAVRGGGAFVIGAGRGDGGWARPRTARQRSGGVGSGTAGNGFRVHAVAPGTPGSDRGAGAATDP